MKPMELVMIPGGCGMIEPQQMAVRVAPDTPVTSVELLGLFTIHRPICWFKP